MKVPSFDYRRFLDTHRHEIDEAINSVLESGVLILGQHVGRFEQTFSEYTGARYAVGVANGTDALFLCLKAIGIKKGDEVITVPNTAVPTVSAIVSSGAIPRFVDICPDTYLMNPSALAAAITNKTKAIIPVHLFGQSCDMQKILKIAKKYSLTVIEDCAQAHGAFYKSRHVGTVGLCGCFSFYPTKNCGAYGDGGMIITDSATIFNKVSALRNYGQAKIGVNEVHGYNSRLDELQASILMVKLHYLAVQNKKRQKIAKHYFKRLRNTSIICPVVRPESNHVFHQFVIRIENRDLVRKKLAQSGVMTGIHYPTPIYKQKAYASHVSKRFTCPVSEAVQASIISLPMFPELTTDEIDYVCDSLLNYL